MIDTNQWLLDFVSANWMGLIIVYGVFVAMFPNSKILKAIGESCGNLFPVFKKKENNP